MSGIILNADYENRHENLKKFEPRGLNGELSIFEPGERFSGTFFDNLKILGKHHIFTGYVVLPTLSIKNT